MFYIQMFCENVVFQILIFVGCSTLPNFYEILLSGSL